VPNLIRRKRDAHGPYRRLCNAHSDHFTFFFFGNKKSMKKGERKKQGSLDMAGTCCILAKKEGKVLELFITRAHVTFRRAFLLRNSFSVESAHCAHYPRRLGMSLGKGSFFGNVLLGGAGRKKPFRQKRRCQFTFPQKSKESVEDAPLRECVMHIQWGHTWNGGSQKRSAGSPYL
jgi:hypothetical protein